MEVAIYLDCVPTSHAINSPDSSIRILRPNSEVEEIDRHCSTKKRDRCRDTQPGFSYRTFISGFSYRICIFGFSLRILPAGWRRLLKTHLRRIGDTEASLLLHHGSKHFRLWNRQTENIWRNRKKKREDEKKIEENLGYVVSRGPVHLWRHMLFGANSTKLLFTC